MIFADNWSVSMWWVTFAFLFSCTWCPMVDMYPGRPKKCALLPVPAVDSPDVLNDVNESLNASNLSWEPPPPRLGCFTTRLWCEPLGERRFCCDDMGERCMRFCRELELVPGEGRLCIESMEALRRFCWEVCGEDGPRDEECWCCCCISMEAIRVSFSINWRRNISMNMSFCASSCVKPFILKRKKNTKGKEWWAFKLYFIYCV